MAGSALALSLARAGVGTTVVARSRDRAWDVGETLPSPVRPVLERLGVWEQFVADRHEPSYGTTSVWGSDTPAERSFVFDSYGQGWHVDRRRFDAMLADAARAAGVEWLDNPHSRPIRAAISVDATGRACRFARTWGARLRVCDRSVAVAAHYRARRAGEFADHGTLVEAVEGGWWYSAALPNHRLVAVYVSDPKGAPPCMDDTVLTKGRFASAEPIGPPRTVSAGSAWLEPAAGRDWLAVGDAAAAHDPLSARGIVSALESAEAATTAILARLGGDASVLPRYAHDVRQSFAHYLIERCGYYRLERRWPHSPFWQRRWQLPVQQGG